MPVTRVDRNRHHSRRGTCILLAAVCAGGLCLRWALRGPRPLLAGASAAVQRSKFAVSPGKSFVRIPQPFRRKEPLPDPFLDSRPALQRSVRLPVKRIETPAPPPADLPRVYEPKSPVVRSPVAATTPQPAARAAATPQTGTRQADVAGDMATLPVSRRLPNLQTTLAETRSDGRVQNPLRFRADDLMDRAQAAADQYRHDEALRLAMAARQIEITEQFHYGPDEDRPTDLVARLERRRALAAGSPVGGEIAGAGFEQKQPPVRNGSNQAMQAAVPTVSPRPPPGTAEVEMLPAPATPAPSPAVVAAAPAVAATVVATPPRAPEIVRHSPSLPSAVMIQPGSTHRVIEPQRSPAGSAAEVARVKANQGGIEVSGGWSPGAGAPPASRGAVIDSAHRSAAPTGQLVALGPTIETDDPASPSAASPPSTSAGPVLPAPSTSSLPVSTTVPEAAPAGPVLSPPDGKSAPPPPPLAPAMDDPQDSDAFIPAAGTGPSPLTWPSLIGFLGGIAGLCGLGFWRLLERRHYTKT